MKQALVIALFAPFMQSAAHAALVVASSGPSANLYPVGKQLSPSDKIDLKNGDTLTLLDNKGTRVLKGKGVFSTNKSSGPSRASTFAILTRERSSERVRTGAVRDPKLGLPPRSPNLWYVDITRSGAVCVFDAAKIRFWRPQIDQAKSYSISTVGQNAKMAIQFAAGDMIAPWNSDVQPIKPDQTYALGDGSAAKISEFSIVILNEKPVGMEATAAALIAHGCTAQLDLLTDSVALP